MKKKKNDKSPFLSRYETFVMMLKTMFLSGEISPQMLQDATGVNMDLCIKFCAHSLTEFMCDKPPEKREGYGRKNETKQSE